MARGRMLNTTIATDQKLNSLSIEAEYLFLKTVPHLDRDGLIHGKPNLLWAKVCPERMDFLQRMDDLVREWIGAGLVLRYDSDEGPVLYFYGFTKNQAGMRYDREGASIFPPPPGYVRKADGLHFLTEDADGNPAKVWTDDELVSDDTQTESTPNPQPEPVPADELRTHSGPTPDELPPNIKEVKLKEDKDNNNSGGGCCQIDSDFGELCRAYEQEIGTLSSIISDSLADLLDEYKSVPLILDAFKVAVKANKRKLSYVEGILENWRRDGRTDRKQSDQPQTIHVPEGIYD